MKIATRILALGAGLLLAGCGPEEPAPVVRDEAVVRREWLFGPAGLEKDIVWRESGLGLRVLAPGEGAQPRLTDRVRVHYVARLKDGHVIDDSHAKGHASDFVLSRLIPGWAEGLAALKPGGRAVLFIPPSIGYGNSGGSGLPPGAGLIFDVELIAVNPEPARKL